MMIVGLSGGFDPAWRLDYDFSYDFLHDAAAVLLEDGRMVAALEQERLNRIKHTNRSAVPAVRACLRLRGATIDDVDAFAFYATEAAADQVLYAYHTRMNVGRERLGIREVLKRALEEEFERPIDPGRLHFADHHMCHALGAYAHSGFRDCLALTLDGAGEGNAALALRVRDGEFEALRSIPQAHSLGYLYREVIRFLGYDMFEEYKVMGLAPYGDPAVHRDFFRNFYELRPQGEFVVHLERVAMLHALLAPRQDDEPFTQLHKDIAAALQEALEVVVFHWLTHLRESTGERRLCLSGGVAHNSTMNGKILRSGLFDEVFVHPAAHDAGGALGAALHAHRALRPRVRPATLEHLFVGTDIGSDAAAHAALERWKPLVKVERAADPCEAAAQLLAQGQVLGWVQGRSEFGPRALGNRSIVADPRPASNMSRINAMIKKREGYRPFAPSVLEEHADTYFEMPASSPALPYMTCVVPVREDKRSLLGAVTHVDGSARVQTVNAAQNPRYYRMIERFGALSGVPVVLNTSFNNNAEPIVDTIDDAVACYLTTALDALVLGDCVVTRADEGVAAYEQMTLRLPETVALREIDAPAGKGRRERHAELFVRASKGRCRRIPEEVRRVLLEAGPGRRIGEAAQAAGIAPAQRAQLVEALRSLWASRLVCIGPAADA